MTKIRNLGLNPNSEVNRVMETRDHLSNGVSPKNQMSRGNDLNFCKMKKVFLILVAVIGFHSLTFGQTVGVQVIGGTTENTEKKDDCAYRISGICATEDLGGVEVSKGQYTGNGYWKLKFENYNNFTVSVIFEYTTVGDRKETGRIVLKANEKKETDDTYYQPSSFKLIARKLTN